MSMSVGIPQANRREARKLGLLLLSKSSVAERERLKPQERNERVCRGMSSAHAGSRQIWDSTRSGLLNG